MSTPTPWKVSRNEADSVWIITKEYHVRCWEEATAHRIVDELNAAEVNSHDALVAAVKAAKAYVSSSGSASSIAGTQMLVTLDAALALAEPKADERKEGEG